MGEKNKKFFKNALAAAKKLAPKVIGALGGPFGGLAEDVLENVLGMGSDQAMEEVAKGNPAVFADLKKAELQMEERMREFDIEEQDLYLKDVADARAMHKANKDWIPAILTFLAISLFGVMSYAILFASGVITAENEKFVWYLLSTGNSLTIMGYSFYLGSSKGSQYKTDILANGNLK